VLPDRIALYIPISNTVAYSDPENGSLVIGQGQVYMRRNVHKVSSKYHSCGMIVLMND
jgi:hypothetical protein